MPKTKDKIKTLKLSFTFVLTVILLNASCSNSSEQKIEPKANAERSNKQTKLTSTNSQKSACLENIDIHSSLDSIVSDPKTFLFSLDDNCILELIDSISYYSIVNDRPDSFLLALEKICESADGFVSEYISNIGKEQFYRNFNAVFKYIAGKQRRQCLFEAIYLGLAMEIEDSPDQGKTRSLQLRTIQEKIRSNNSFSSEEIELLNSLIQRLEET